MPQTRISNDTAQFRRILTRNVTLPLGLGLLGALLFVALIAFLLNTIGWVEHTDTVLRRAGQLQKYSIDKETGMRGFLITGDATFLQPFDIAAPRLRADTQTLMDTVADNPTQVERLKRIQALQTDWDAFAEDVIARKRRGEDVIEAIRAGRGKRVTDEIRREFESFTAVEQRLRVERNDTATTTAWVTIVAYLVFTITVSGGLAFNGRRELLRLSSEYGTALEEQARNADILRAQAWLRDGQRQLADGMAGKQLLADVGHEALAFLTRYLGGAVAALYVRTGTGELRRVAGWALGEDAERTSQMFKGTDSLVAEAACRKQCA